MRLLILLNKLNKQIIFLNGAGRSGIAIRAFANRLMHIGFSVSIVERSVLLTPNQEIY